MDSPRTRHRERGFLFIYFIGNVMVELTPGRCKDSKTIPYFFPGFSSMKKGRFGSCNSKWFSQKNSKEVFLWIPYQKRSTQPFLFQFVKFCAQETARGPKKILFLKWTWVEVSTWDFSAVKHCSHKPSKFDATFSIGFHSIQKKLKFFGWAAPEARPKTSFFRDENPKRFFLFSLRNGQKSAQSSKYR